MEPANPVYLVLAVVFILFVGLVGAGILFAPPSNIERTLMVGGATLFTAIVAGLIVALPGSPASGPALVSACLLSVMGYVVGRVIDVIRGPEIHVEVTQIDADLAD
jgi:hypothetical protein